MYVNGEREVKVIAYALIIAGLVCLAGLLLSGGCGYSDTTAAGGNGTSTSQQAQRAAELNWQAGAAVDAAAGAVGRAEQHAEQAAELNQSAQAGAADSKELVELLKADNRRAKRILDELISNAQTGAAAGTEN